MKKRTFKPWWMVTGVMLVILGTLGLSPNLALAEDNTATGDLAGDPTDLTDSNTFTLNSITLALVKAAFLTDGTQLSSGNTLPRGTLVQFMVYMDNTTPIPADDVNVQDILAAGFLYQAGTIKVDNSVATGSTEAAIYAAVNATVALTDLIDGDAAGISGTTVSAGAGAGNGPVNAAASSVWALLFTVEIQ